MTPVQLATKIRAGFSTAGAWRTSEAALAELLARLSAAEQERDEYKRRDQLKANRPLAESLLFRDKSEMGENEQAVASYVGQCIATRSAAEARAEAAEQALREIERFCETHMPFASEKSEVMARRCRERARAALAGREETG